MPGVANISATIAEPGVIRQTGTVMRMVFGELDGSEKLARPWRLAASLRKKAGIDGVFSEGDSDRALDEVHPARLQRQHDGARPPADRPSARRRLKSTPYVCRRLPGGRPPSVVPLGIALPADAVERTLQLQPQRAGAPHGLDGRPTFYAGTGSNCLGCQARSIELGRQHGVPDAHARACCMLMLKPYIMGTPSLRDPTMRIILARSLLLRPRLGRRRRGRSQTPDGRRLQAGGAGARSPNSRRSTGHKVTVENATAGALQKRIADGEYFDVVVLPPLVLGPVPRRSRIESRAAPRRWRASASASAIKQGAPVPDISDARSLQEDVAGGPCGGLHRSGGGRLQRHLSSPKLFEKLGIAEQLKSKSVLVPGGLVAERVVDGQADIALHQISEILAVPGAAVGRPDPARSCSTTRSYSGGVSTWPRGNRAAADALPPGPGRPFQPAAAEEEGHGRAVDHDRSTNPGAAAR